MLLALIGFLLPMAQAQTAGQVRYFPRVGLESRMVGGQFQGSTDNSTWTTFYTVTTTPGDTYTTAATSADPATFRYLRYLAPDGSYGNVAEIEFDSGGVKLTGTTFGTPGSYNNGGSDYTKVFDGDTTTYFDAPYPGNGDYAGIDQGPFAQVGQVRYFPRTGYESRMVGGQFQGSTDNSNWVTLYTITTAPSDVYTAVPITSGPRTFRYLRYLSPNNGECNVAEIEFDSGTGSSAVKITGVGFGTPGSYNNSGNDFTKALDGNTATFFDSQYANGSFVGIDQGSRLPPAADVPPPGWAQEAVPTDSGSDGGPDGPGSSMDVSLPSGVEENNPGPDLDAYNSVGPSAVYERMYRSVLAVQGYASPGLSLGWVDNFDLRVTPGSGTYTLHYPNGAAETWTGTTGSLATPSGAPYLASSPAAGTLTMEFKDRSVYTFTQQSAASASGLYPAGTYLLTGMRNLVGHSITLNRDTAANNYRVLSITNDAATPVALLQMSYNGGFLSSVQDLASPNAAEHRQVSYTFTGGSLSNVSQVAAAGGSAPDHWRYAYQTVKGTSLLSGVSAPSPADPTGQTYSSAAVSYDPTGFVTAHTDANNHLRSYNNIAGGVGLQFFNKATDTTPILQQTQTFASGSNVDSGFTDAASRHASIAYSGTPSPYLPSAVTNRNQQMSSITYDPANAYGNVASVTDPRGVQVNNLYQYPSDFLLGQLASTQTVSGSSSLSPTTFTYYGTADGVINGLLKTATSPLPGSVGSTSTVTSTYFYDALGNVTSMTMPGPNSTVGTASTYTTVTYNYTTAYGGGAVAEALGEPQSVTVSGPASGGGTTTTTTYFKYDGRGNRTATIDCLGNETDTAFNLADQMTSTLYPATGQTGSGRSQTSIAYEYTGGPADTLSVYDEGATTGPVRQTTYTYGPEGELLKTSDLLGPVAAYQYDGLYRTTAVQDGQNLQNGQGKATLYSYDLIGNLAKMLYPLASGVFDTTTYTYDNDSNLLTRTDGNNAVTTYVRDQAVDSRLTGVNYPSGSNTPNVTLGYDAFERLSSLSNSAVAKTYSYDDIDEMLNATVSFTGGPQSQAMTYGYAPDGSRTSLATPLGSYSYQYDGLGQLTRAGFPWTGGYVNHTYVKNATTGAVRTGWLATTTTPRGLTSYNYNALGQIVGLSNQWANYPGSPGSKTIGSNYGPLAHDALGNKTNEPANIPAVGYAPDISHTLSYGYDTRDELTGEQSAQAGSGSGGTSVYGDLFSYDLSYNPLSFKGSTVTENADNQFSLSGYIFDGNGNPTTYSGKNLAFDIEDRLVAITSPAFAATYAPDDRRVSKTANGTTTYYLYDEDGGASPLLEEQGTSVSMGYGMAGDGLRARYAPASGGLYYLFQWDPQGSLVQRQTGGSGGGANNSYYALDTAMFDGYGAKLGDTDAFTGGAEATRDAMGFQGQFGAYTDNETGLVLMGHRYYDAETGRFLTRDPKGYGGGINLYGFTGNNPVNESDPDGTQGSGSGGGPDQYAPPGEQAALQSAGDNEFEKDIIRREYNESGGMDVPGYPPGETATEYPPQREIGSESGPDLLTRAMGLFDEANAAMARAKSESASEWQKAGRAGKQARLRALAFDVRVSRSIRGWLRNEMRHISTGNRSSIRLPYNSRNSNGVSKGQRGMQLAHPRNSPARLGNSYSNANLQDPDIHAMQTRNEKRK